MNNVEDTIDTKNENNELRVSIIDTMDYYEIKFAAICLFEMNARSKTFFYQQTKSILQIINGFIVH